MTGTDQPRKPGGSPEGGQFAGKEHGDAGIDLTAHSGGLSAFGNPLNVEGPSHAVRYTSGLPEDHTVSLDVDDYGHPRLNVDFGDYDVNLATYGGNLRQEWWDTPTVSEPPSGISAGDFSAWAKDRAGYANRAFEAARAQVYDQVNEEAQRISTSGEYAEFNVGNQHTYFDGDSMGRTDVENLRVSLDPEGGVETRGVWEGNGYCTFSDLGDVEVEWDDGEEHAAGWSHAIYTHTRAEHVWGIANEMIRGELSEAVEASIADADQD